MSSFVGATFRRLWASAGLFVFFAATAAALGADVDERSRLAVIVEVDTTLEEIDARTAFDVLENVARYNLAISPVSFEGTAEIRQQVEERCDSSAECIRQVASRLSIPFVLSASISATRDGLALRTRLVAAGGKDVVLAERRIEASDSSWESALGSQAGSVLRQAGFETGGRVVVHPAFGDARVTLISSTATGARALNADRPLAPDRYQLTVEKTGYVEWTEELEVGEGVDTEVIAGLLPIGSGLGVAPTIGLDLTTQYHHALTDERLVTSILSVLSFRAPLNESVGAEIELGFLSSVSGGGDSTTEMTLGTGAPLFCLYAGGQFGALTLRARSGFAWPAAMAQGERETPVLFAARAANGFWDQWRWGTGASVPISVRGDFLVDAVKLGLDTHLILRIGDVEDGATLRLGGESAVFVYDGLSVGLRVQAVQVVIAADGFSSVPPFADSERLGDGDSQLTFLPFARWQIDQTLLGLKAMIYPTGPLGFDGSGAYGFSGSVAYTFD